MKEFIQNIFNEEVIDLRRISGGCIAKTYLIKLKSKKILVKQHENKKLLSCEAYALREIANSRTIKVPEVLYLDKDLLVLEYIENRSPSKKDFKTLGKQLARMHKCYSSSFGFFEDNFIGSTPQINTPVKTFNDFNDWLEFYWENRIYYQWQLAKRNSLSTNELDRLLLHFKNNLKSILKQGEEGPCLLHGDLWSGNFLISQDGTPYLIDPAVYYGHREAELGMTKMFGGFQQEFYQAYNQEYPLRPGWEQRMGAYILYHALNHLNLFGHSYYQQCINLLLQYK